MSRERFKTIEQGNNQFLLSFFSTGEREREREGDIEIRGGG